MRSLKYINILILLLCVYCQSALAQNITYEYVGCFAYPPGLKGGYFCDTPFTPSYTMSNQICSQFCAMYQYKYSVTYNGASCCCYNDMNEVDYGNSGLVSYQAVDEAYCTTPCYRNSNEMCGGQNFYEINVFGSSPSNNSSNFTEYLDNSSNYGEYFGCMLINSTEFSLKLAQEICSSFNSTIDSCIECCSSLNMSFAIAADLNCYCSEDSDFESAIKLSSNDTCGMTCLGNYTQYCGGSSYIGSFNRIIYQTTDDEYYVKWLGSYKVKYSSKNPNLFIEVHETELFSMVELMRICSIYGFSYGYQSNPYYDPARLVVCFSYMNQTTPKVDQARTNHPIDLSYIDFSEYIPEVYQLYKVPTSFRANLKTNFQYKPVGCFSNSFADAIYTPVGTLTNKLCSQFCFSINYTYSGTRQLNCFCGNELIGTQVDDSECYLLCGATGRRREICGGPNSLTVYKNSFSNAGPFFTIVPNVDVPNMAIFKLSSSFEANRLLCGNLCRTNLFCQSFIYKTDQNCTLLSSIPDTTDYFQSAASSLYIRDW